MQLLNKIMLFLVLVCMSFLRLCLETNLTARSREIGGKSQANPGPCTRLGGLQDTWMRAQHHHKSSLQVARPSLAGDQHSFHPEEGGKSTPGWGRDSRRRSQPPFPVTISIPHGVSFVPLLQTSACTREDESCLPIRHLIHPPGSKAKAQAAPSAQCSEHRAKGQDPTITLSWSTLCSRLAKGVRNGWLQ